jgi:hypothetical protein
VTAKVDKAATLAAEEGCVGQAAAVQSIGGGGGGGNSSGIGFGKCKGSGDGSDVACWDDLDCCGGSNSNIDSNSGNGNSDWGSGINGNSDACFCHG